MDPVPFTRIAGVLPAVRFLERAGAPVEVVARRAGVPSWLFDRPDALLPIQPGCRFFHLAARTLGRRWIGASIGRDSETWDLGILGALLARSGTVYELLQGLVTYLPSFASGHRDWLEEEPDRVWLCQGFTCRIGPGLRQVRAFVLVMMIQTLRSVLGRDWMPERVRVPDHGRDWVESLELGTSIEVDPDLDHVAIAIPRPLLPFPVRREAPPPGSGLRLRLAETAAPPDLLGSLRIAIQSLLADERPSIQVLADAAGSSPRSLQRQLAAEGLTFSQLLDGCRLEKARKLLGERNARAIDVAYELGYHDPGNFTRAFRRWTGVTPREFRRQLQADT